MYLHLTDIPIESQDHIKIFKCICFMWELVGYKQMRLGNSSQLRGRKT